MPAHFAPVSTRLACHNLVVADEILKRIDEHMARGNELMEEIRRERELDRATFAEHIEVLAGLVRVVDRMRHQMEDQSDETRAQTKAVLRLLDRFGDAGTGPATA